MANRVIKILDTALEGCKLIEKWKKLGQEVRDRELVNQSKDQKNRLLNERRNYALRKEHAYSEEDKKEIDEQIRKIDNCIDYLDRNIKKVRIY